MLIRVLTYNIHKAIGGVDRRYRLGRVAEVIGHYDPHIALLQEVDEGVPRSRGDAQFELLSRELGYAHGAYQKNVRLRRGAYGNAVLSRLPLEHAEDFDLTVRPKKRRRAQIVRLALSDAGHRRTLVVANLHLGLAGFERRIQLRRLLHDSPLSRVRRDTPCLVGGDFNDVWASIGARIMRPAGFESATGLVRTFPARAPLRPLDHVYFRGPCSADHAYAGRIALAREASDHLPLVAELRIDLE
ncbi:endonuclease/exonuclease/phosphatase family protein [Botrimarina sp.]|uniref:endonuclease/exonuclease/phosphatase family protein n=1 Tax=Botrimarina sp. TaxID=2795802 RepID=UPI0032EBA40A